LFRLPADQALINRAGFNNNGAAAFADRVKEARPTCVLGVSIGKSRAAAEAAIVEDHIQCFRTICEVADYVAVNVSSPNTPGLRDLQRAEQLEALIQALQAENKTQAIRNRKNEIPLLIKLAPDLELNDLEMIVDVAKRQSVAGLIATNTTVSRDGLKTPEEGVTSCGAGGLSGAPLRTRSTQMIADLYRLCAGSMKIIGVGGIFSAEDAWDKICAGASLVQLYTGFIYRGPLVAKHINRGLVNILRREQIDSIDQAVGCRATEFSRLS
jgi:dihydroorotate dehydrogenase